MWDEYHTPECACPICGCVLDAAAGTDDQPPGPGDVSVCIECAQLITFNDDLTLRALTPVEFEAFDLELKNELQRYMAAVRSIRTPT